MNDLPKLHFPPIRLRARQRGEAVEVWDSLRGIYLVLTPEEWVRQHLIACLIAQCGAQPTRIVQEYAVQLNGQPMWWWSTMRRGRCWWPSARRRT